MNELVARARRDDKHRSLTVRFDSGFWNNDTIINLGRPGVRYTMGVHTNVVEARRAIAGIDNDAWQPIDTPARVGSPRRSGSCGFEFGVL